MKPKMFLLQLVHDEILRAVRAAERKTSGEIRVFVSHGKFADPLPAARRAFKRLGMEKTKERNGVLIFISPKARNFAIIGDQGVHEKCGESFWTEVAGELTVYFKGARFTEGIVHAVGKAGELLARHFPRAEGDVNELGDEVVEG